MQAISQHEICQVHKKLFSSLKQRGVTSLAEYVSYSYLTILDLYLNANQQEDYESCINAQVLRDPKSYCLNHLKAN
jgi:hypothetical protein